jgi:hypothetical protein
VLSALAYVSTVEDPARIVGPTAFGLNRLSCEINRPKNSNGSPCARAADSTKRQIEVDVVAAAAGSGFVS